MGSSDAGYDFIHNYSPDKVKELYDDRINSALKAIKNSKLEEALEFIQQAEDYSKELTKRGVPHKTISYDKTKKIVLAGLKRYLRQSESGLEKKTMVFLFVTIVGIALGVGSLTITGHAVSNLTQTTPGLLGTLFFIVGLTGVFFCSKKK